MKEKHPVLRALLRLSAAGITIPLLLLLEVSGLAAIIAWYVILSIANSNFSK